jgi:hypothetical protein
MKTHNPFIVKQEVGLWNINGKWLCTLEGYIDGRYVQCHSLIIEQIQSRQGGEEVTGFSYID